MRLEPWAFSVGLVDPLGRVSFAILITHNLKVLGSNPTPATNINNAGSMSWRFLRFTTYLHHRIIAASIAAF